jgi:hypothetical protein
MAEKEKGSCSIGDGLDKIEKAIFPVGKIQEKESFSAAKEIVDSPIILNQCGI